jgi:Resolvase, N terminal domain
MGTALSVPAPPNSLRQRALLRAVDRPGCPRRAIWEMDRLGRSLRNLITMLDDSRERGVALQSLTEAIDTTTPTGRAR